MQRTATSVFRVAGRRYTAAGVPSSSSGRASAALTGATRQRFFSTSVSARGAAAVDAKKADEPSQHLLGVAKAQGVSRGLVGGMSLVFLSLLRFLLLH